MYSTLRKGLKCVFFYRVLSIAKVFKLNTRPRPSVPVELSGIWAEMTEEGESPEGRS